MIGSATLDGAPVSRSQASPLDALESPLNVRQFGYLALDAIWA